MNKYIGRKVGEKEMEGWQGRNKHRRRVLRSKERGTELKSERKIESERVGRQKKGKRVRAQGTEETNRREERKDNEKQGRKEGIRW